MNDERPGFSELMAEGETLFLKRFYGEVTELEQVPSEDRIAELVLDAAKAAMARGYPGNAIFGFPNLDQCGEYHTSAIVQTLESAVREVACDYLAMLLQQLLWGYSDQ